MKHFSLAAIALVLLTQSCKKPLDDMADYYPIVRTESVALLPNGTVKVVGRILTEGDAPIDYAGFCVDTVAKPDMLVGQAVAELNGDQFTVVQLTADEAVTRMNDASLYGFILIPETFSADLATYAQDAATSQPSSRSG